MTKCAWEGCTRDATWQIEVRLWARSMEVTERTVHNCLRILSPMMVCDKCKPRVRPWDPVLPGSRAQIEVALTNLGKDVPDFDRAALHFMKIEGLPIDSIAPPDAVLH